SGDSSTVTLTLSSGTFANGSTTVSIAAVSGVATFSSLIINTTDTYTLKSSYGTLTTPTSTSVTINPASASKLAFVQQPPASSTSGVALTPAITTPSLHDALPIFSGDSSTVTLTLSSGTFANGSTTVSIAAVSGVATFSSLI